MGFDGVSRLSWEVRVKSAEFRQFLTDHGIICSTPKEIVPDASDGVKHYSMMVHPRPGVDSDFEFERADIGFIGYYVDEVGHLGDAGKCYLDARQGDWPRIKKDYILTPSEEQLVLQAEIKEAVAEVRAIAGVIAIAGNPSKRDIAIYVPALVKLGNEAKQVTYVVYEDAAGKVQVIPQATVTAP